MKKIIFAVSLFILGWAAPLKAEIMTYQGRLKESDIPVNNNRYFTFQLCTLDVGGTCFPPSPTAESFTVTNGLFKSTFTVPAVDLSAGPWYLQVSVGPTAVVQPLSPREQLTAVPYSVYASSAGQAATASGLSVLPGSGVAGVVSSTNVIVNGRFAAGDAGVQLSTGVAIEGYARLQNNGAGAQDISVAVEGRVTSNSTEDIDIAAGGNFEADVPAGMKGLLIGVRAQTRNEGTSQRAIGMLVDGVNNTGTLGETYGIFISTQASGTQTNAPYALFSADPGARSYFAGNVGISSAAPAYALSVSSGAGETGTIMAVSTGTSNLFWVAGDGAHATSFHGDGSGLTNVAAASGTDSSKVLKTGDTMTGWLQMSASSITITADTTVQPYALETNGVSISTGGSIVTVGSGTGSTPPGARAMGVVDLQTSRSAGIQVAHGFYSVLSGGRNNESGGFFTVVGGGQNNSATGDRAAVLSGESNTSTGYGSVVAGGDGNMALNTNAAVAGGEINKALSEFSTIGGGQYNVASASNSVIAGGRYNVASGTSSVIGGGEHNAAGGLHTVLGGGLNNLVSGQYGVVAGGQANSASAFLASVSGGWGNTAGGQYSAVSGGAGNSANGNYSAVSGGAGNAAQGDNSWAGGFNSSSTAKGSFTWADSQGQPMLNGVVDRVVFKNRGGFIISGSTNTVMQGVLDRGFIVTGAGYVGISTGNPQAPLDIVGTGGTPSDILQIWRTSAGTIVSSVSATGVMMSTRFVGDGSGLTGVTGATGTDPNALPLAGGTMSGNIAMGGHNIYSASTITATGDITAASYQINGSTVVTKPGTNNIFIGSGAGLYNTTGSNNAYVGANSAVINASGVNNAVLGASAAYGAAGSFSSSTVVGSSAGYYLGVGADGNTLVGYKAGYNIKSGANNIIIGANQFASGSGTASAATNELNIGGVLYGDLAARTIGISTRIPQAALDIVSTGGAPTDMAQIWRNSGGAIQSSMSATGVMMAVKFVGDGSGLTGVSGVATAGLATSLAGGLAGYIPYQSSPNNTAMLSAGSPNQILQSNGAAAPSWTSSPAIAGSNISGVAAASLAAGVLPGNVIASSIAINSVYDSAMLNPKVNRTGDAMSGQLTTASTITVQGSAFSVGGSTFVVVNGGVGIGVSNPQGSLDVETGYPDITFRRSASDNLYVGLNLLRSRGTSSARAPLAQGDMIGNVGFTGYDGASYLNYADITGIIDGPVSGGVLPSALIFGTGSSGGSSSERMRISSAGDIGISTGAPQARLDIRAGGSAATDMAQIWRNSAGTTVSSMSATGVMMAAKFVGDGSGLLNLPVPSGAVAKIGDSMSGQLTTASTITVQGDAFSVGLSTFMVQNGRVAINNALANAVYSGPLNVYGTDNILSLQGGAYMYMRMNEGSTSRGIIGYGTGGGTLLLDEIAKGLVIQGAAGIQLANGTSSVLSIAGDNAVISSTLTVKGGGFSVGGSTLVVTGGFVGIGTNAPAGALHVVSPDGHLYFASPAPSLEMTLIPQVYGNAVFNNNADGPLVFNIANNEQMRLARQNLMGVGTNNPLYRLHVSSGAGETGTIMAVSTGATNMFWVSGNGAHATTFWGDGSGLSGISATGVSSPSDAIINAAAGVARIQTAGADRMVVDSAGNVAIGAASPGARLQVNTAATNLSVVEALRLVNPGAGNTTGASLTFSNNAGPFEQAAIGGFYDNPATGQVLAFYTGNAHTEQMRIIGNGYVGISTTTPVTKFTVDNGSITVRGTDAGLVIGDGARVILPEPPGANGGGLRVSTNVYVVGFSSAAKYYGDGSGLTNVGDNLGNHKASMALQMMGYGIVNVSTITLSGDSVLIRAYSPNENSDYGYAVSIGSGSYNNYSNGIGIGYAAYANNTNGVGVGANAYGNGNNGVGVGFSASGNATQGVGVGYMANNNYTAGVGIGASASGNTDYGVGVGYGASGNINNGVGVGRGASGNGAYAVGIGANSMNSKTFGSALGAYSYAASSSVALGSYAQANANQSIAIGNSTVNDSTGTASFGTYGVTTSSSIAASNKLILHGQTWENSVLVAGDNGLVISTGGAIQTTGYGHGSVAGYARGMGAVDLQTVRQYGSDVASGNLSVIAGGTWNSAAGNDASVGGGLNNHADGIYAVVPGGSFNTASAPYSFAAGYAAKASAQSAFTWQDSGGNYLDNNVQDRVVFKSKGGFIVTGSTDTAIQGTVNRAVIITGGGLVGISTGIPQAALDVVSTGATVNDYAQIWRNSAGIAVASMTSTGVFYGVTGSGDNLGNHLATQALNMNNFAIWSSSSITAANYQIGGSTVLAILSGTGSLGIGTQVGTFSTGNDNTFIGFQSAKNNTAGADNSFVGFNAGITNTIGQGNSLVGAYTATNNQTGSYNSVFGYAAGGSGAVPNNSFSSSTIIGAYAGYNLLAASADNIFLGYQAGYNVNTGTGNIVIGFKQDTSVPAANNELNIGGVLLGNLSAKTLGIGSVSPNTKLQVLDDSEASGTGFGKAQVQSAVKGIATATTARTYRAGVAGYLGGLIVPNNSAGVLGAPNDGTSPGTYGALGYRDGTAQEWAGYFSGNTYAFDIGSVSGLPTLRVSHATPVALVGGTGYADTDIRAAISAVASTSGGYNKEFGVAGYVSTALASESAGILGAIGNSAPSIWGGLGYVDAAATSWAGYFNGNTNTTGDINVTKTLTTDSASMFLNTTSGTNDYLELVKGGPSATGTIDGINLANLSRVSAGASAGPLMLRVVTTQPMYFLTSNVERMRIDAVGNVGIAVKAPISKLQVVGDLGLGDTGADKNQPIVIWLNASTAINIGDVVAATGPNQAGTTTFTNYTDVIGVAVENITAGAWGKIAVGGVATVNCATGTLGQHAVTAGTAGLVSGTSTPAAGASIGLFLTPCGTPAVGQARLLVK